MKSCVNLSAGILACCFLTVGCPSAVSERVACERAMAHYIDCAEELVGEEFTGFEEMYGIGQTCAVIDWIAPDCDMSAYFNCLAALSCDELIAGGAECMDELEDLEDCFGTGF